MLPSNHLLLFPLLKSIIIFILWVPIKDIKAIQLDYHLYSQILAEHFNENGSDFDMNGNFVVNYFKLNQKSMEKYDSYLHFPQNERLRLKSLAKQMFEFGYDNYMKHAFPMDELDPIHCLGRGPDRLNLDNININDVLGDYLLTLVDSLSTLVVFGNASEFQRASKLVIDELNFDKDNTVQVFEATIRVLGGLLSAHLIASASGGNGFGDEMRPTGYDNQLLELAHDLGTRLLSAFENRRDIELPFPRVNLKYGVPHNSFNHTCTSGAGTLILEFAMLGSLLNDPIYEKVARTSMNSIFSRRNNETGLFGNELNIHTGEWIGMMSGLGAGLDSFYEYLLKSYIIFGEEVDYKMFEEVKRSVDLYLKHGRQECSSGIGHHPIYLNVNMLNGKVLNNWIDSLQASYPSVQILDGDLENAICFHALYFAIWKKFGVLPERFNWNLKLPDVYFYPLRPEFAESTYFLYRATKNPFYLHVAKLIIENIYQISKVKCGFATVHDVLDKSLEDRMESFFLSETIKYLYLTFDKENFLNNEGELEYLFTTEGHLYPIKQAYLLKKRNLELNKMNFKPSKTKPTGPTVYTNFNATDFNSNKNDNENDNNDDEFIDHCKSCDLNMSNRRFYNMRFNLPMKMRYFDQLFEMVGLNDNLEQLLDRKINLTNKK